MPELHITFADAGTKRHLLGKAPVTVGRDSSCELAIDDASMSRRHARFVHGPQGYSVEDLGSKNGTLVNDDPRSSQVLRNGDHVLVGSTLLVFKDAEEESAHSVVIADDATYSHATRYATRDKDLKLSQKRLQMIYELGAQLTTLKGYDQLLEDALTISFEMLQFERGAIGVSRPGSQAVDWPVVRNLRSTEGELKISRTLLTQALKHGERAIFTPDDTGASDPTVSMIQQGIRSAMCVPLIYNEKTLGVIYGDRVQSKATYTSEDIDFLAGIAQQVSIGIINCRLAEEQRLMIRLARDLDLAREIQQGLFPSELPNRADLVVEALNEPGMRVSGDYYDVVELDDGRVWCLIADVAGEGMSAALIMANLQAAVRLTLPEGDDPGKLMGRWNRVICRNTKSSKFITCLLMLIDPRERTVRFASAGHFPPMVIQAGDDRPRELEHDAGFPLGIQEAEEYSVSSVELGPDPSLLVTYTDGIVEAMNHEEDMFGSDALKTVIGERKDLSPGTLVKRLRKEVSVFAAGASQSDDITIFAARIG